MKRFLCTVLSSLALLLCACQTNESVVIAGYGEEGKIPTHICRLSDAGDYALLLRRYDEAVSAVATAAAPEGDMTVVYTLPDGKITYELAASGGIIAFFELTSFTDGSVSYALKVIDTNNNNAVYSPYGKTVSEDNEIQTRFIAVYGGCVYYLTKSNLLERCRVMKYSVKDNELTEYLGFEFTENEMTKGSSCTFISEKAGYLTCGVVDGNRTTLKTYDLNTNELVREKLLPYNAELVYTADHDYASGAYAIYYLSAQGDERIASFTYTDNDITDIMKLDEKTYVNREAIRTDGENVYFELQDSAKEAPYDQFTGYIVNAKSGEIRKFEGCASTFEKDGEIYGLCFDEKRGAEKMILKKLAKGA